MNLKEWLDIFTALGLLIGGLFAFFKWRHESYSQRLLRERELRWKQAESAKELLDDLGESEGAQEAFRMLDWDGLEYEISPGLKKQITESDYVLALRIWPLDFDQKEAFIRDAFDQLFAHMATLEHYLQAKLVRFEDVQFPYDYYMPTINRNRQTFEAFLEFYQLRLAQQFLGRLNDSLGEMAAPRNSWREMAEVYHATH